MRILPMTNSRLDQRIKKQKEPVNAFERILAIEIKKTKGGDNKK